MRNRVLLKGFGILTLGFVLSQGVALAHGDHSAPGALPSPTKGGKLAEAMAAKDTASGEFFVEAVVKDKKLLIYPLLIDPKEPKKFKILNPKDFPLLSITSTDPRTKKTETLKPVTGAEAYEIDFDFGKTRRQIVTLAVTHDGEKKTAEIQVEKK